MSKQYAIHHVRYPIPGARSRRTVTIERRKVRVMAVAEGYAMVRRPGCAPYVANMKDLTIVSREEWDNE